MDLCVYDFVFQTLHLIYCVQIFSIWQELKQKVVFNGAINKKTSKIEVIFEQSSQIESYKKASEKQGERLRS